MNNLFKRLLSFVVALVMVLGMIPVTQIEAKATTTESQATTTVPQTEEPYCPSAPAGINDNLVFEADGVTAKCVHCNKNVQWTALTAETTGVITEDTHYYVPEGGIVNAATTANATDGAHGPNFLYVKSGTVCLHLQDNDLTTVGNVYLVGGNLSVMGTGTWTSTFYAPSASWHGAIVSIYNDYSVANLYGGKLVENSAGAYPYACGIALGTATKPSAINVYSDVEITGGFHVSGGTINFWGAKQTGDSTITNYGTWQTVFNMEGGNITSRITLQRRAGSTNTAPVVFNMKNGVINTTSTASGSAFAIFEGAKLVISGGEINGNNPGTSGWGGVIYTKAPTGVLDPEKLQTEIVMTGGAINAAGYNDSDKTHVYGGYAGAIYLWGLNDDENNTHPGKGTKLTMTGGTINGTHVYYQGGTIYANNAELEISGTATITSGKAQWEGGNGADRGQGGNIYARNSSIVMNGGTISNGIGLTGSAGGGNLYLDPDSSFTMTAGTIKDGTNSWNQGGNIFVDKTTVNISGGVISGGTACNGGSIALRSGYSDNKAILRITGGIIKDGKTNSSASYGRGGNIYLGSYCEAEILGGTVTGGTANYKGTDVNSGGGNIYMVGAGSKLTIGKHPETGVSGIVSNGVAEASSGGNILVREAAKLYINEGAEISGGRSAKNVSGWGGGNIYVYKGTVEMNDGTVSGGSAANGGSVLVKEGTFNMYGGEVTRGTTLTQATDSICGSGGNFYLTTSSTLNVLGGKVTEGTATYCKKGTGYYGGGNICVNSGTATIGKHPETNAPSEISGGEGWSGGNILLHSGGNLVINDGAMISGGYATGVPYISNTTNGTRTNVHGGGNIYASDGRITMNGGTVTGGIAEANGGNIMLNNAATLTVTGGLIQNGESKFAPGDTSSPTAGNKDGFAADWGSVGGGGNIFSTGAKCKITVSNATIQNGKAAGGGNIMTITTGNLVQLNEGARVIGGDATEPSNNTYYRGNIHTSGGTIEVNAGAVVSGGSAKNARDGREISAIWRGVVIINGGVIGTASDTTVNTIRLDGSYASPYTSLTVNGGTLYGKVYRSGTGGVSSSDDTVKEYKTVMHINHGKFSANPAVSGTNFTNNRFNGYTEEANGAKTDIVTNVTVYHDEAAGLYEVHKNDLAAQKPVAATCVTDGYILHTCSFENADLKLKCEGYKTDIVTARGYHDWNDATCTTPKICRDCDATEGEALGHTEVIDKAVAPTCTATGLTEGKHCSVCGTVTVAQTVVNALGHTEVVDQAVAPTCTETGLTEGKHCSVCGTVTVAQTVVNALGHTEVIDKAVAPTCTETGKTEGKHCSVCNTVLVAQNTVDALDHDYKDHDAKAPTCTEIGWDAYQTCSRCDYTTYVEKTALGHTWNDATCTAAKTCKVCGETQGAALDHDYKNHDAKAPTCTEIGWDAYQTCSRCDYTTYVEKSALGHATVNHDAKAPTCTEIGWDAYQTCSRCDYTTYVEKSALDHDYKNHDAKAPTCTEIGWDAYQTCSRCDYTTYVEKSALGHATVNHDAKAPTCTEIGWDAYQTCSRCDYTTYVEKSALDHDYKNHDAKAPTCTEIGWDAYQTCSRCDYTTYVEKSALGHATVNHDAKAPTCTEIGWDAYQTCSRCDYTTYVEKTALGHAWNDATCTAPKTCGTCGATEGEALGHDWDNATCTVAKTCKVCNATEGAALGHAWNDATCTAPKTCEVCGTTEGEALGHNYKVVASSVGDCQNKASQTEKCENCGNTVTTFGEIDPDNHKMLYPVTEVPATVTSAGTKAHYKCACGALFTDASGKEPTTAEALVIPKLTVETVLPSEEELTEKVESDETLTEEQIEEVKQQIINVVQNSTKIHQVEMPADHHLQISFDSVAVKDQTVTKWTYDVTPMKGTEVVEKLDEAITFYLPIPTGTGKATAAVLHDGKLFDADAPIVEENGEAYVVVTSSEFSPYTVDLDYVEPSYVAMIGQTGYTTLLAALADAKSGDTVTLTGNLTLAAGDIDYRENIKIPAGVTLDGGNFELVIEQAQDCDYAAIWSDGAYTVQNITIKVLGKRENVLGILNFTRGGALKNAKLWTNALSYGVIYDKPADGMTLLVEGCEIYSAAHAFYCDPNSSVIDVTLQNNTIHSQRFGSMHHSEKVLNNTLTATCTKGISLSASFTGTVTGNTFEGARALSVYGNQTITGNVISANSIVELNDGAVANLSGNYWGGEAPAEGQIVADKTTSVVEFTVENYYADEALTQLVTMAADVATVNGTGYKTLEEAFQKITDGATVTLLADLEIVGETYTIPDGMSIILDMNGKKITATDNKAAKVSYELFYIYGEMTVTGNGTIELTSTSNDTAYAKSSSIFQNRGGVLTIENGTYKHLGGTAMAFVVDNSANSFGDAYLYVNGGEIISETYIAVRMRMEDPNLNGDPGNGLSIAEVTGGYIFGANRGIWGQKSSSANELQGKLTVTGGTIENTRADRGAIQIDTDSYAAQNMLVSISGNANIKGALKGGNDEFAVSGGTFTVAVPEEYCAEGYQPKDNGDGTYGVIEHTCSYNEQYFEATFEADAYTVYTCACGDTYTVTHEGTKKIAVAIVNGEKFETLAEAIAAAQNGETVTLLADVALTSTLKIAPGKDVTLDLNGKTVSGVNNTNQNSLIYIENTGKLTVKDSADNGKITYASGSNNVGFAVDVKGDFVLESGTIELTGSWSIGYAVDVRPNSWGTAYTAATTFVMNGGSVISSDGAVRVASSSASAHTNVSAAFTMNGGKIDAAWDGVFVQQSDSVYDVLSFTMNGGTIESDLNPVRVYGPAATDYVNGADCMNIVLNDGTMTYTGTETYTWIIDGVLRAGGGSSIETILESGELTVSAAVAQSSELPDGYEWEENADGNFVAVAKNYVAQVGNQKFETLAEAIAAAQNGETVTLLADVNEAVTITGKQITLDLNGQKISGGNTDAVAVKDGANVTIKNGTLETHGTNCGGVWVKNATALIEGCTINGLGEVEPSAVYASNGATVTIKDSVLTAKDNGTENVWALVLMSANVTVENCVLNGYHAASGNGTNGYDQANLTINSGEFNGLVYWPAEGNLTINGGEINEIEMRSGSMTINGGQIGNIVINNVAQGDYDPIENVAIVGGTFTGTITSDLGTGFISGGTFSNPVAEELCAEGYIPTANTDGTYGVVEHTCAFTGTVTTAPTTTTEGLKTFNCECGDTYTEVLPVLPQAIVTDKGATTYAGSYYIYDVANGKITSATGGINLPKTLVFTAQDKGETAENHYYADYNTDFYVKLDGLSAETVRGTGCYLAGYYAAYELWVVIPLDNVDIQNGLAYPLLAIAGQDFSYEMICNGVEEFTCGLYLSDEFLAANPDVQVTVDLGLREEPADLGNLENLEYFESEGFEYAKDDLDAELVAEVNGVKYYTLAEAIAAAQNGETVTLLADVALTSTLKIAPGKDVTLDLNGKTVSGVNNTNQSSLIYIENTGKLTVKDSADNGKITYASGSNNVGFAVDVKGDFVLESGTIELTGSWSIGYAVDVRPNSWGTAYTAATTFVMNGGSVISSDGAVRVASSSASAHTNVSAAFTMNGGKIDAAWDGVFVQQSDSVYDVLSFTMNGGTIESDLNPVRVYGPAAADYVNGADCMNITLNNGTLTYTGTETYTWIIDGVLRAGGGSSIETILESGELTVSAAAAQNFELLEGYVWVENADGTYSVQKREPSGKVAYRGYVNNSANRNAVQIDLENVYATESLVIELYDAQGNLLTTTSLKAGAVDAASYTCNIVLWGNPSGSWDTVIHAEKLTVANAPATIKVIADGVVTDVYENALGDKYPEYNALPCIYKAAKVGNTYYATLAEAVAAATDGATVTLLADIDLVNRINVARGEKLVLDLNGHVIDITGNQNIAIMSYGDLTIKDTSAEQTGMIKAGKYASNGLHGGNTVNVCAGSFTLESGTIYSLNNALLVDEEAATITINGGKLYAEPTTNNSAAMYISSAAQTDVTINDGELVGFNGILLWDNTTINMVGGSIDAQGRIGIQGNGSRDNTEINLSGDASVYGLMAGIYHPQGGVLTITDNVAITGGTGIVVKGGNVTISGGTISGEGEAQAYAPNGSGFVSTGDALYVEHFDNSTNSENYGIPVVTVTGGTFTSVNGEAIGNYANTNMDVLTGYVSGGTFSNPVAEELCAEGYIPTANTDGTYGVKVGEFVARVNGIGYETLAEAIAAAQNGETVTLLADVELNDTLVIPYGTTMTLDLNGHTISQEKVQNAHYEMILVDGNLTIKDSVGGGKISYTDLGNGGEYGSNTITNRGTLTLESGTVENLSSATVAYNGYPYAIDSSIWGAAAEVNTIITGGTVSCTNYSAIRLRAESKTKAVNVTVNGGVIYGTIEVQNISAGATGKLTVNGGELSNSGTSNVLYVFGNNTTTALDIEIAGGDFTGNLNIRPSIGADFDKGIVSGGTFASPVAKELCAEGYIPADNGDGTYGVIEHTCSYNEQYFEATFDADAYTVYTCTCGDTYTVTHEGTKKIAVATVNDERYETFAAAIQAAAQNGGVVILLADVTETAPVFAEGVIIDLNGKHLTADIFATIRVNGGIFETSEYVMVAPENAQYISTDAVIEIAVNNFDTTLVSGTVTLGDVNGWTLAGQTLTVGDEAKFIIPTGYNLNVQNTVVVNGEVEIAGTVTLYNADASVQIADDSLNVVIRDGIGDKAWYNGSAYVVHTHTEETIPAVAPTLTQTGLTEGLKCSVCGDILKAQEVVETLCVATVNGTPYAELSAALNAAYAIATATGEQTTVVLEKNLDLGSEMVMVMDKVTLDLNGKTLKTSNYVLAIFNDSNIVDSSADNSGLLAVDLSMLRLLETNKEMPYQTEEGIKFAVVVLYQQFWDGKYYVYLDRGTDADFAAALAENVALSEINFQVQIEWGGQNELMYTFRDGTVAQYAASWETLAMNLKLHGAEGVSNLTYNGRIVFAEGTDAEVVYQLPTVVNHPQQ